MSRWMAIVLHTAAVVGILAGPVAGPVAATAAYSCRPGTDRCPTVVHLVRGGPARTVRGRIRAPQDRFVTVFRAAAGATLLTRFKGPAVRLVLTYPNGEVDGPGFAERLKLTQTGRYRVEVSPDTMADGIFGPFALTLRLR